MQIEITSDANEPTLAWKLQGKSGRVALTAPIPSSDEQKVELVTRLACHYLVENVEDIALNELLTTLVEIADFYRGRAEMLEHTGQTEDELTQGPLRAVSLGTFQRESFSADDSS